MIRCIILLILGVMLSDVQAQEARLLRFPTTNGKDIVFSYAGDLYRVSINGGAAQRITSHIGYEIFPKYAPDGKTVAFTGQYDGNSEVYTVPDQGGEPLRLTYTSTNNRDDIGDRMGPNNIVMAWTPDGKNIVYRNRITSSFTGRLYKVDREGGLSEGLPLPEGGFCSYSPDGKKLAYNRVMREFRTWKYYEGGMADDIWIYDPSAKSIQNISNHKAQDIFPMWIGDKIYYASDRDRTMNLFVYDNKTKQTAKVTDFKEYDVKFPSHHGNVIVFENGGYIYKLDVTNGKPEKVNITLTSDNIYARSEIKDGKDYITYASLSPDGERLAITSRGEVFDLPSDKGVTRNITRTPGAHERGAQWSPDGKNIAFISDKTGETELYLYDVKTGNHTQLTKNNDTYIRGFDWSPDSRSIVYTDRENRIVLVNIDSKNKTTLLKVPEDEPRSVSFSPDSKWITYTRRASNNFNVVFVMNLANKMESPITDKWYESYSPVFSADGKYIVFSSARDFNPVYGSKEWNHVYSFNNSSGIYLSLLRKDMVSPFIGKDPVVNEKKMPEKKDSTIQVTIDFDGLQERIVKLPLDAGSYWNFYMDGDKVYYSSKGNTMAFDLKSGKEETITEGASMQVGYGSKKALFSKRGQYFAVNIPKSKTELKDAVNLSNMKITTDYTQEWAQIYDEAWRVYRDGFYVSNMHGVDWKAMKKKYEVMLPFVKNRLDLNYLIGEMIGELKSGHAYVNPGEAKRADRIKLGLLGAEISRDKSGYFRIEKILEGATWDPALRSPFNEPGIQVKKGDFIVGVDGVATNTVKDLYALLVGKANVSTELMINSLPKSEGATKIVITPIDDESALYQYEWVQNNIKKVDQASNGKIGYIYIPDMGVEGLNEFARYYYPQLDKEGLIIDDRANGGGNVSPMILERLSREPYRLTMGRGTSRIGTIPNATQVGPKVCLINKYSASDGDLFPWGFKALGLGKLIGTRTWGGIIGISGSLPFIDGTDIRVPFFTSYDAKTGEWIIENHGVDPDIVIDNDPIKEWGGEDQQLNKAIEEVMKELKDRKPLKPVPAPRIWNK
ncbi:MAG TPA: PDZ domain-containing protein [Saprospiraceae bacterium]|nr:PD40 domain-containing protein [Saprospiraceae bacterium]HRO07952.1 PDZ domain-containing protein [Saprospiraceae bacterium]HRP41447.1 PDZ domain-containing protein [Saprospiraceae bacterium]